MRSHEFGPEVATPSGHPGGPASIVLINGSSSAGKTTLARALASELGPPWQSRHVDFAWPNLLTSGRRAVDTLRTIRATTRRDPGVFSEWNGVVTFLSTARVIADHGTPLVLDCVLVGDRIARYLSEVFDPSSTLLVAADCPLETLQAREARRPTRRGHVARQFPQVHRSLAYDTVVDTSTASVNVLAAQLAERIAACPRPVGLSATSARVASRQAE